ncbi:hypothetical protein AB0M95_22460 [Sphaerisporangium sp. NPDC051017]
MRPGPQADGCAARRASCGRVSAIDVVADSGTLEHMDVTFFGA